MAATNESMSSHAAAPQERQRLPTDEENSVEQEDHRPLLKNQQRTRGIKAMAQSAGKDAEETLEADQADHRKSLSAMS